MLLQYLTCWRLSCQAWKWWRCDDDDDHDDDDDDDDHDDDDDDHDVDSSGGGCGVVVVMAMAFDSCDYQVVKLAATGIAQNMCDGVGALMQQQQQQQQQQPTTHHLSHFLGQLRAALTQVTFFFRTLNIFHFPVLFTETNM
jgi:hypothetical protein